MYKITPLTTDPVEAKEEFRKIANAKSKRRDQRLLSLLDKVSAWYATYAEAYQGQTPWTNLQSATLTRQQEEDLKHCYTSGTQALRDLKQRIEKHWKDQQVPDKCPFCMLSRHHTKDHYLPKEEFPEYAVLVYNLLPCCSQCNGIKDTYWREDGVRGIINFYTDSVIDKRFLEAQFQSAQGDQPARPTFFFKFEGLSSVEQSLVENHYARFQLLDSYDRTARDWLSENIASLVRHSLPLDVLKDIAMDNSREREKACGMNYYEAVLWRAVGCMTTEVYESLVRNVIKQ